MSDSDTHTHIFSPALFSVRRKRTLLKNRCGVCVALLTSNASDQNGDTLCLCCFSSREAKSPSKKKKSWMHRHVQYCKTHTHTYLSREGHRNKTVIIPSTLSWSQQNVLKTTFLINLSHQIKRTSVFKKKKKGFSHLPKKAF